VAVPEVPDSQNPAPAKPPYSFAARRGVTRKLLRLNLIFALFLTLLVFVFYVLIKFSILAAALSGSVAGVAIAFLIRWIAKTMNLENKLTRIFTREISSFVELYKERAYKPIVIVILGFLGTFILCLVLLFRLILPLFFDPYTNRGWLTLNDDLQHYNSNNYQWDNDATVSKAGCQLTSKGYQVIDNYPDTWKPCVAELPQYQNFVFEARMTISKGGDCGGFLLRDHPNISTAYLLRICTNGSYRLARYTSGSGFGQFNPPCVAPKGQAPPPDCQVMVGHYSHPSQSYLLAIAVDGSTFTVYVNHDPLQSQDDTTNTTEGHIGFVADTPFNHPTTVTFTDVRLWTFLS